MDNFIAHTEAGVLTGIIKPTEEFTTIHFGDRPHTKSINVIGLIQDKYLTDVRPVIRKSITLGDEDYRINNTYSYDRLSNPKMQPRDVNDKYSYFGNAGVHQTVMFLYNTNTGQLFSESRFSDLRRDLSYILNSSHIDL